MNLLPKTHPCASCGKPNNVYRAGDYCVYCQASTRCIASNSDDFIARQADRETAGWVRVGCISSEGISSGWRR